MPDYKPSRDVINEFKPTVAQEVEKKNIKLTERELFAFTREILTEYGAHLEEINPDKFRNYVRDYIPLCSFAHTKAERPPFFSKERVGYIVVIIISILYLVIGHIVTSKNVIVPDGVNTLVPNKAKVTKIISTEEIAYDFGGDQSAQIVSTEISFYAKVRDGEHKGETVRVLQTVDPVYALGAEPVELGDSVLIYNEPDESGYEWHFYEYLRTDALIVLGIIFVLAVLIFGKMSGVNTLVSLAFTCLAVFIVFIPSVLSAQNIYISSIVTCLYIIAMTLPIISGINKKTLTAIIGCASGVLLSGILTVIMSSILGITGLIDDDSMYLMYISDNLTIDLKAIIFAGIIIGAVGAIMDVAMSMSSSLYELARESENPTFKSLMKSGVAIGRDIMGTMANTLILAYIGSSLSVTLLLVSYNKSLLGILNREMLVVEILQSLVGSLGILLTIPLTAVVASALYLSKNKAKASEEII